MTSELNLISTQKVFAGELRRYQHESPTTACAMTFAIYFPKDYIEQEDLQDFPVLYWLSGLTCNDENFCQKAGAFKKASELGLIIVCPDTSPRGSNYPGEHDSYDIGSGAGFYLNATENPWAATYQMYDYVVKELPDLIERSFRVGSRRSISGHSMGGHGALICGIRNPKRYRSISAFSPIVNPIASAWGRKAFGTYLGNDESTWCAYDACELIASSLDIRQPILVDQGLEDEFLEEHLKTQNLEKVCQEFRHPLIVNMRPGYDHSYYFVSTFIDEHLDYHHKHLTDPGAR